MEATLIKFGQEEKAEMISGREGKRDVGGFSFCLFCFCSKTADLSMFKC